MEFHTHLLHSVTSSGYHAKIHPVESALLFFFLVYCYICFIYGLWISETYLALKQEN